MPTQNLEYPKKPFSTVNRYNHIGECLCSWCRVNVYMHTRI